MSYLEPLRDVARRVSKPFAEANSWSEYAGRAYWRLGAIFLVGAILLLLAGGYVGGIMSRAPSSVLSPLEPIFEWFKPANILKAWPWPVALIAIYSMVGLIPQFRGLRDFLGGVLANSFYWVTEKLIGLGERCIRHRGGSMMLIGVLTLAIGWATTMFFTTKTERDLREQRFDRWQSEVERFVLEEALVNHNKERLSNMEDLWQADYSKLLQQSGGYTHTALHLRNAILLLNMPEEGYRDYSVYLKERMTKFKNERGGDSDGFEEIAAQCEKDKLPKRHAATLEEEQQACDVINLLLGKLSNRLVDDQVVPNEQQLDYIKKAKGYYDRVDASRYTGGDLGRPFVFTINNGMLTVYNAMLSYLMNRRVSSVADAPCKTEVECARAAFDAYEKAERALPLGQDKTRAVKKCSAQAQTLANNLTDLLRRITRDYDAIAKGLKSEKDSKTLQLAHMQSRDTLRQYIEQNITKMMSCNPEVSSLPDLVTTAQAYGACVTLEGPGGEGAKRHARAAGVYLRLANSIEPDGYPNWDLNDFCAIYSDQQLGGIFDAAITDAALSGMPELSPDDLRKAVNGKCP
jgi:hypothetical protein